MVEPSEIGKDAGIAIQHVGGEQLVDCRDASAFLDACERCRVRVLGADGFDVRDDGLHPYTGVILDLSTTTDCDASIAEARRFVEAVGRAGLMFSFVLA